MNFLFPYMARWQTANYSRYHGLLKGLAQLGHKVIVLQAPRLDFAETNFLEVNNEITSGISVIEINVPDWLWKRSVPLDKLVKKGSYSLMTYRCLQDLIDAHQIDVLFLYNLPQCLMLFRAPCISVFDVADDLLAMFAHELGKASSFGLVRLGEMMFRSMLRRSDLNLVASQELQMNIKEPTTLLPNGADLDEIGRLRRIDLPVDGASPVVGYMGAFEYFVDMDMVLDTAATLPDVVFWLVGGGRDFFRVKERVANERLKNVRLPGPVDHKTGLAMMAATDICLLPRRLDAFSHAACPLKLFEYAALEKPILSAPTREVLRIAHEFAFFARDPGEMKTGILDLLNHSDAVKTKVAHGFKLVKNIYNWQILTQKFVDIIGELVSR
jgi:glycosyltransferase involved in cell wall biosynthesis